jgi:hypothetical protein
MKLWYAALQKIWLLLGYALKQHLHDIKPAQPPAPIKQFTGPTYYVRHPDDRYSVADPQPHQR